MLAGPKKSEIASEKQSRYIYIYIYIYIHLSNSGSRRASLFALVSGKFHLPLEDKYVNKRSLFFFSGLFWRVLFPYFRLASFFFFLGFSLGKSLLFSVAASFLGILRGMQFKPNVTIQSSCRVPFPFSDGFTLHQRLEGAQVR